MAKVEEILEIPDEIYEQAKLKAKEKKKPLSDDEIIEKNALEMMQKVWWEEDLLREGWFCILPSLNFDIDYVDKTFYALGGSESALEEILKRWDLHLAKKRCKRPFDNWDAIYKAKECYIEAIRNSNKQRWDTEEYWSEIDDDENDSLPQFAQDVFKVAIQEGLMYSVEGGYKWMHRGGKASLSYFLKELFERIKQSPPWKRLGIIFGEKRLDSSAYKATIETKYPQKWRKEIDDLINSCES